MQSQRIALIGLGAMGAGMGANWLKKGFALAVYNRSRDKAAPLVAAGAKAAASPREAAAGADVIVAVVSDDPASRAVWLGPDGALAGARPGAVLVESSTLTPGWVMELASKAAAQGCDFLDATLAGSKPAAIGGQIGFFVGGDTAVLDKARPALEAVSARISHLGPTGAGARWKLINNMLGAIQMATVAEALVLAGKAGFDVKQAATLIASSAAASPIVQSKAARMADGHYGDTDFALGLMRKDIDYATDFATQLGVDLTILRPVLALFRQAEAKGFGASDAAAVIKGMAE